MSLHGEKVVRELAERRWVPSLEEYDSNWEGHNRTTEEEIKWLRKKVKSLETQIANLKHQQYLDSWELDKARGYTQQGQL
jgi:hypothetical protein